MKKYLLSVALLVAVCISAKAQFSVGIKGGVNFSNINTDNFNSSTRTGYQAGVFARFGSAFYLQPEVYLSSTGGKFVETQFSISRNDLQVLMSENKQVGIEILWRMENLLVYPHGMPATINLVDLFGTTQAFKTKTGWTPQSLQYNFL